uniref:Bro-b protein n=1 Tax=Spilarctia obliqua nucleopolyhedrovirus TaxID=1638618 RepID=A0A7G9U8C5_9ABAC|nr:Bro-b protein [Spilarctia obliqua nucleopolyhedrovirus]
MKSKLPYAVELQAWLLEEVIPQVLCTGKYAPAVKMDTNYNVIEELNKKLMFASESLAEANENYTFRQRVGDRQHRIGAS